MMQYLNDAEIRLRLDDSSSSDPEDQVAVRLGVRKEPCVVCGLPVFLAEKLVISRSLYHRTCFRCARCNNQLTLGNYYETEEGQYCCETCPDEELPAAPTMHQDYNKTALSGGRQATDLLEYQPASPSTYKRALSDEEKTSERANKPISSLTPPDTKGFESPSFSEEAKIRLNFMTSHLLTGNEEDDTPSTTSSETPSPHPADNDNKTLDESDHANAETSSSVLSPSPLTTIGSQEHKDDDDIDDDDDDDVSCSISVKEEVIAARTSPVEDCSVNNDKFDTKISSSCKINQHPTAIANHDLDYKSLTKCNEDTKDTLAVTSGAKTRNEHRSGERLSLVQQRMKMFENNEQAENKGEEVVSGKNKNEPNSVVNIVSKIKRDKDKGKENNLSETMLPVKSPPALSTQHDFDASKSEDNSTGNMEVEYESKEPLNLPEEKPFAAAVILKKMMDSREPRKDTSSLDTSLSNVSGIDLSTTGEYPDDLNPFDSDDSDIKEEKKLEPLTASNKSEKYVSTNPFGSSDEDEDEQGTKPPPRPAVRKNTSLANKTNDTSDGKPPARRRLEAPQISLNPFWSDDEDHESDEDNFGNSETKSTPVPKPRKMKPTPEPSPVPRKTSLNREGLYASNSSITSTGSLITPGGTYRKKKPAPPPPPAEDMFSPTSTFDTLALKSTDDTESIKTVSERTPRTRKTKPAPPPPMSTSTPQSIVDPFLADVKEIDSGGCHSEIWDDQKTSKDETNRNRQSLSTMSNMDESGQHYSAPFVDKSAQGKWKRKKGPAPPRPIPHKRKIKVMSIKDVKLELDEIELQQQGLEKQGVRLEQLIRDKCETGQENEESTSLRVDVEELVLELFALVNEKNELFRRQAELMLLRRQQRLEEEHADVEYQIRCLMSQPEATKTDSDKQREELLIQRLVEIVERRNEIVECLEMDRRREVEEDRSIHQQMGLFAAKSKGDQTLAGDSVQNSSNLKKEKVKEKHKEKKIKKSHKKDADKDVDETEMKLKRHKKKWF